MAKQPAKRHMSAPKRQLGMPCPKDGKEMKLAMVLASGKSKGAMHWSCECGHQQIKRKGDHSAS